ncbi:MAG: type II toxin-antitoxin system PemK/MazF family toxin [Ignavibacteria bacterium]|nr:type II toxin-antitoxin system PemK/MazF family toxin [Ignavibacteria bacterium]
MKTGNIILVPFPFSEITNIKVRPAVVISTTKDKYEDVIVSAISSVIPNSISANEIIIKSNSVNNL